jgi:K+-transporting ATPase ATPase A chain
MVSIFLIPAALCFAFGIAVGDKRQGWAILAAMTALFVMAVMVITPAEQTGNPLLPPLGVDQTSSALQSGGNMEGKETRFGINASTLFATITTAASCGAVNSMHDSYTPIGGMVPMVMMQLGEVVFGGTGHWPVRHAGVCHSGGLHSGADDWPHAGVPGQEDRGP